MHYTNLSEIAHAVKAVIIIVISVHVNLSTHFVFSHVWRAKVSPEWWSSHSFKKLEVLRTPSPRKLKVLFALKGPKTYFVCM